jgi:chitinase
MGAADAGLVDDDGDGIINDQEVSPGDVDPGLSATPDTYVVGTPDVANPQLGVLFSTDADVISIRAVDTDSVEVGSIANRPEVLTGLISFKLGLLNGATTADVTVNLTEPAPADAIWYKYDLDQGWVPYGNVIFSGDRKSITIHLIDGGAGDDDGVQNGVIVDPSGLGYSAGSTGYGISESTTSSGSSGGGCFIAVSRGDGASAQYSLTIVALLAGLIALAAAMRVLSKR